MLFYVVKKYYSVYGAGIGGVFIFLEQKHSASLSARVGTCTH
jgi:hypothetical protein